MIFNLYDRLLVKLGDERHVFDRRRLMYTEVAEIEKVTGLSYAEWERELGRYSITAIAALVHVLRKREDIPSDFAVMQFNAAELDVVPVREDGTEFTQAEVTADLARRMAEAQAGPGPTLAGDVPAVAAEAPAADMTSTSPSSLNGSGSARGNGNGSRGRTSSPARRTSTPA